MIKSHANRTLIVVSIAIILCFSGGCRVVYSDDHIKAEARFKQIIEIIKDKDKDALESIFSIQALNEAEDLELRMDYLFEFMQGDVESWEPISRGSAGEHINNGSRTKWSGSWYYVNTDNQKYLLFFTECVIDTDNPDNVGLYMLQLIKAEDRDTEFDGGGPNTRCAGIYMPKDE